MLVLVGKNGAFHNSLFFFNNTAPTEIYTLSLHDALPISSAPGTCGAGLTRDGTGDGPGVRGFDAAWPPRESAWAPRPDRKSTRLNSSHDQISYAVFCLKKKIC